MAPSSRQLITFTVLAGLLAYLAGPVKRRITVLGLLRQYRPASYNEVVYIKDTIRCEDLHYLPLTNELITACEDNEDTTANWFPPITHFDDPNFPKHASIHVINPDTFESKRLVFKNFDSDFVSHGIDVIPDPNMSNAYFIFAINHLPNPAYKAGSANVHKARSQVELFHYVSGSDTAEHLRSIRHPLISTPNDLYAISPNSFYVTNDHHNREGPLRQLEVLIPAATWSTTIYVEFPPSSSSSDPEADVEAHIALSGIHNNNGIGHVRNIHFENQEEVMVVSCASGLLHRTLPTKDHKLTIVETIPFDTTLDNPSYFADPYPTHGYNASGYVACGLGRGIDFVGHAKDKEWKDPAVVWHVTKKPGSDDRWEKKLIFEDDGSLVRGATTAVIVPIKPESKDGEKLAWLFVTSVLGRSMIAVKVAL